MIAIMLYTVLHSARTRKLILSWYRRLLRALEGDWNDKW
jgi:hypothetical protein